MNNKLSSKTALLVVAAMAACAFAMPSMASAASWGVVGTEHTLHSANGGFISHALGITASCSNTTFTADVSSAARLTITSAAFNGCTSSGPAIGDCTKTLNVTGLPWTATAVTTSNLQIHGVDADVLLEDLPSGNTCAADGLKLTITGTVTGGVWTGNGAGQHSIEANGLPGLVFHSALGNNSPLTLLGTVRDTQQTLTVS